MGRLHEERLHEERLHKVGEEWRTRRKVTEEREEEDK